MQFQPLDTARVHLHTIAVRIATTAALHQLVCSAVLVFPVSNSQPAIADSCASWIADRAAICYSHQQLHRSSARVSQSGTKSGSVLLMRLRTTKNFRMELLRASDQM